MRDVRAPASGPDYSLPAHDVRANFGVGHVDTAVITRTSLDRDDLIATGESDSGGASHERSPVNSWLLLSLF